MKLENKKYLVYGGLAVIVGSVGYILYSLIFVKKQIAKKDETVESVTETPTQTNTFKDLLDNPEIPSGIDWKFQTPPIAPKGFFDTRKNIFMN